MTPEEANHLEMTGVLLKWAYRAGYQLMKKASAVDPEAKMDMDRYNAWLDTPAAKDMAAEAAP